MVDARRASRTQARASGNAAAKRRPEIPWLALLLTVFAIAAYGGAFGLPFIGDDYVFLDKTLGSRFGDLWSFGNTEFGWYRPWSRELHFWALQHVAGLHEAPYRIVGVMLWVIALSLYAMLVRRLATTRVAALATMGVASLALWGTPLTWISGSQDLWMLCFALASVLLFAEGHVGWTLVPFGLALLSKETAAVLPVLLCSYAVVVDRRRVIDALRRTAHFWALLFIWLAVHPTLRALSLQPRGDSGDCTSADVNRGYREDVAVQCEP